MGHLGTTGDDLADQLVAEGVHDGANLVRRLPRAVELLGFNVEQIVGDTVNILKREFANPCTARGADIALCDGLHRPAGYREQSVNLSAGLLFQLLRHGLPRPETIYRDAYACI